MNTQNKGDILAERIEYVASMGQGRELIQHAQKLETEREELRAEVERLKTQLEQVGHKLLGKAITETIVNK